ncbi:MAG: hypothetical protein LBF65_00275 [Holosporales bacterium]|nr:hypothetical protein [Holosporales bacterium]
MKNHPFRSPVLGPTEKEKEEMRAWLRAENEDRKIPDYDGSDWLPSDAWKEEEKHIDMALWPK